MEQLRMLMTFSLHETIILPHNKNTQIPWSGETTAIDLYDLKVLCIL